MLVFVFSAVAVIALLLIGVAIYVSRNPNLNAFQRRVGYFGVFLFSGILVMALYNLGSMWYRVYTLNQLVPLPENGKIWAYKSSGTVRYWWMSFPRSSSKQYFELDSLKGWEFISRSKNNQAFYRKEGYLLELDMRWDDIHYIVVQSACVSRSHSLDKFGYAGYWVWPSALKCDEQDRKWNVSFDETKYELDLIRKYGEKKTKELIGNYGTATEAFFYRVCRSVEFSRKSSVAKVHCPQKGR